MLTLIDDHDDIAATECGPELPCISYPYQIASSPTGSLADGVCRQGPRSLIEPEVAYSILGRVFHLIK